MLKLGWICLLYTSLDMVQRIAGANYSRHAEFAGDDGGMAGTTAPIGDDLSLIHI